MDDVILSKLLQALILRKKHDRQESLTFITNCKNDYKEQITLLSDIEKSFETALSHEGLESEKKDLIDNYYAKWKELSVHIQTIDNAIRNATDVLLINYYSLYPGNENKYKSMKGVGFSDLNDYIGTVPICIQEGVYYIIRLLSLLTRIAIQATRMQGEVNAIIDIPHQRMHGVIDYGRMERIIKRETKPIKNALTKRPIKLSQEDCAKSILDAKKYYRKLKEQDLSGGIHAVKIPKLPDSASIVRTIQRWDQYIKSKAPDKKGTPPPDGYNRYQSKEDFDSWARKRESQKYQRWETRLYASLRKKVQDSTPNDENDENYNEDYDSPTVSDKRNRRRLR